MSDPFVVLDLGPDATDADVELRYRALLVKMPPDTHPEAFTSLRAAYDALRTARGRVEALLFAFDASGRDLQELAGWVVEAPRRPPTMEALRAAIRDAFP